MTRRGFIAALLGLPLAPLVAKAAGALPAPPAPAPSIVGPCALVAATLDPAIYEVVISPRLAQEIRALAIPVDAATSGPLQMTSFMGIRVREHSLMPDGFVLTYRRPSPAEPLSVPQLVMLEES